MYMIRQNKTYIMNISQKTTIAYQSYNIVRGGIFVKKMWEEFKAFAVKGNVMDMAEV